MKATPIRRSGLRRGVCRFANVADSMRNALSDGFQAIGHAVVEWNVDVISMSFTLNGTEEDQHEVKAAIKPAYQIKPSILMFAAASNNKHVEKMDIGFPARIGQYVICINSHRGDSDQGS